MTGVWGQWASLGQKAMEIIQKEEAGIRLCDVKNAPLLSGLGYGKHWLADGTRYVYLPSIIPAGTL